jgi:hypothetical protein
MIKCRVLTSSSDVLEDLKQRFRRPLFQRLDRALVYHDSLLIIVVVLVRRFCVAASNQWD